MSSAPWSVKGIDPKTREAAKESARRSGMTLGEWLNHRIQEQAATIHQPVESDPIPLPGKAEAPASGALAALADKIDAAEQRQTLAVSGLDQSMRGVLARMETAEKAQAEARRKIEERVAKVEQDGAGPRSAEALRVLEASMNRIAHRANDAEARAADSLDELKREIAALARRLDGLENSKSNPPGGLLVLEQRMEQLAITLTARVDAAKAEMAGAVDAAGARSAHTVERIGHEVLRMADTLGRRVQNVETRTADAIEQVGGEVAKVISTLEGRIQRSEGAHAEALEKLGGEIARISEKLAERITQSERRAAQAIDDVGEQVSRTTERLNTRYDRASADLAERIRLSEERTARLLDEAKERIDARLADSQRRLSEQVAEVSVVAPEPSRAFAESFPPAPPVIYPDAAPFGQTFAPQNFTPVEPDFAPADIAAADNFITPAEPQTEADFVSPLPPVTAPAAEIAAQPEAEPDTALEFEPFPAPPVYNPETYQPTAFEPAPAAAFQTQAFAPPPGAPVQNASPTALSTREMIEQARAAARAAAQPQNKTPKVEQRGKRKSGGLPFLGRKNNLKNALMMGVAVVALGAVFTGVWSLGMLKGVVPDRVADNQMGGPSTEYRGAEFDTTPRAAMALNPEPIAPSVPPVSETPTISPNAAVLFRQGVELLEAGDKAGLEPLKRAANLGLPDAQSYLGRLYESGKSGVTRDVGEARRWYERAAQAGDRMAMHNLGYYYFDGAAGPKNMTVAAEWFRRAALLGVTDSQYNLARLYENGQGVAQNPAEAYKWYLLAARNGTPEQQAEARTAANNVGRQISEQARANAERTVQVLAGQIGAAQARPMASAQSGDVALAQRALVKLGYYRGAVDGQASAAFQLAVQAYQRDRNIPATGQVDQVTFQALRPHAS